jgi:hypothetical protein
VEERVEAGTAVCELRVSGRREEDDGHSKNRTEMPKKKRTLASGQRQRDGAQVRNGARAKRECDMS